MLEASFTQDRRGLIGHRYSIYHGSAISMKSVARQIHKALALGLASSRWSGLQYTQRGVVDCSKVAPVASRVRQASTGTSKRTLGKRFYKNAVVKPAFHSNHEQGGGHEVALDKRIVRTPAKQPLRFTNPLLAHAIAAEWEWQDTRGVRSFTMPLMKLAVISVDQMAKDKDRVVASLLKYCHTDALCCRASEGSALHDKQATYWDPLLDWVGGEIGARPVVSSRIFGPEQPEDVITGLENYLRSLNDWQLAAIDALAGAARSIMVALAIARHRLSIEQAIDIVRLEENHQVEDWGYVEGGHDIDEADIRVRISAASVFLRLL